MNDEEKYALYQQAVRSGGPCEICGWRDGDGTRTCFYSSELGIVKHQNSQSAVEAGMTESQRSLLRSYNSLHDAFEHSHDPSQCVQSINYNGKAIRGEFQVRHTCGGQFVQQRDFSWVCSGCGEQVAEQAVKTRPRELFWGHKHILGDHSTCVKKGEFYKFPHLCGGTGEFLEAYHLYCSGCDEEVKLWEHGIDYDVG